MVRSHAILKFAKYAKRNEISFLQKREKKKHQMEEVFDKLKAPSPDNESIRLQNLIEAATAGDLEAVRKFLRPTRFQWFIAHQV